MVDEYIKREDAISYVRHAHAKGLNMIEYLHEVPAIEVRPIVYGRWINDERVGFGSIESECSICGRKQIRKSYYNFCPNCGANMRGNETAIS